MTKKIKSRNSWAVPRRGPKKQVTFSNKPFGGKSDYYEPGKYPFNSAQFFKKSNITTVPLVKKQNVSSSLSSKNVKPIPPVVSILKNSKTNVKPGPGRSPVPVNSKPLNSKPVNSKTKVGGRSIQDPSNALFTSPNLKTTSARGTVIDSDKFNRQWSLRKQFANYPMNAGIYASSMPAAKSNTSGGAKRRYKKSRKTKSKTKSKKSIGGSKSRTKKRGSKPKSKKTGNTKVFRHSKRR